MAPPSERCSLFAPNIFSSPSPTATVQPSRSTASVLSSARWTCSASIERGRRAVSDRACQLDRVSASRFERLDLPVAEGNSQSSKWRRMPHCFGAWPAVFSRSPKSFRDRSRNVVGSDPNSLRNARDRWLRLAYPTAAAMHFTGSSDVCNNLAAFWSRTACTKPLGLRP